MSYGIFGDVVDDDRLDQMSRYCSETITREDRAREAMRLINYNFDAIDYVESLKYEYGDNVSALCVVYNGTGDTLYHGADYDWYGHIGSSPYPSQIRNGQWGAFQHVCSSGLEPRSKAAVVYQHIKRNDIDREYLIAWDIPFGAGDNKAYCDVGFVDSFQRDWAGVETMLGNSSNQHAIYTGESIEVDIGSGTSPIFKAVLSSYFNP